MSIVMIKYGELNTKKDNRMFFIKTLAANIEDKLEGISYKLTKDRTRMFIEVDGKDLSFLNNVLSKTFGIQEYVLVKETSLELEDIKKEILALDLDSFKTFKINTRRGNKSYPYDSMELNNIFGGYVLKNTHLKVDVHNPDLLINVEIRKDHAYIYGKGEKGLGGYPAGVQKKGIMMLSGGLDSPVAAFLAMKRGVRLEMLYFESLPHTSLEAREKIFDLTEKLSFYAPGKIKVHIVNFTKMQEAIYKYCDKDYMITIMRRMMYRISERLAKRRKALVIVNGESIGQVASQTLSSMSCINSVTNMPVIRPVATLDKLEIIDIAKKIDTYDISIKPFIDCCTVFVPKHPVINPSISKALSEEEKFDYEELINDIMKEIITVDIPRKEELFSDIL